MFFVRILFFCDRKLIFENLSEEPIELFQNEAARCIVKKKRQGEKTKVILEYGGFQEEEKAREEGIKLLQNSIDIKTAKLDNYIDKLKAVILIEIKIVVKYEDFIKILLSQLYGTEARNIKCQKHIFEYIDKIEKIVEAGIEAGQIKKGNSKAIASEIYGLIASSLVYRLKNEKEIDVIKLYREYENTIIEGLK